MSRRQLCANHQCGDLFRDFLFSFGPIRIKLYCIVNDTPYDVTTLTATVFLRHFPFVEQREELHQTTATLTVVIIVNRACITLFPQVVSLLVSIM